MMKKCKTCGEEKPATPEFFYKSRSTKCKECLSADEKQRLEKIRNSPKPQYGPEDIRKCPDCGEIKLVTEYHKNNSRKDGLQSFCKECMRIYSQQRNQTIKNSPNPQYGPEDAKKCPDCGEVKLVTEFQKNSARADGLQCYCKKCSLKRKKAYERQRYKTDSSYKLTRIVSSGVLHCLNGEQKTSRSMEYIGMDVKELWQHLESQFQPGMTRENHAIDGWHLDHIRPIASFKLQELEGEGLQAAVRECWHYTNLQPLWAEDNMKKGAKYESEESTEVNRDSETTLPDLLCEESEVSDVPLCLSVEEESADINWAEQG
jgi:hypothetical protein